MSATRGTIKRPPELLRAIRAAIRVFSFHTAYLRWMLYLRPTTLLEWSPGHIA